jgi:calcium-binding protein CML
MPDESKEMHIPRRANEFRNVFDFLDKNGDGNLTKDEMRFIMNAVGHELTDEELRELIQEIAGAGEQAISEEQFLNFVYLQLQGDPADELREIWKIASTWTKTQLDGETPKEEPGISPRDAELVVRAIGGDLTSEEALELVKQASRGSKLENGQINFEELCTLLQVPQGGQPANSSSQPPSAAKRTGSIFAN